MGYAIARLIVLIGILPACIHASIWKQITLPDGSLGYSIRCDNENVNACYEAAGEVCNHGYDIKNAETQLGQESSGGAYLGPGLVPGTVVGGASSKSRTTSEKGLLIQCKESERTEAERAEKVRREAEDSEREHILGAKILVGFVAIVFVIITGAVIIGGRE